MPSGSRSPTGSLPAPFRPVPGRRRRAVVRARRQSRTGGRGRLRPRPSAGPGNSLAGLAQPNTSSIEFALQARDRDVDIDVLARAARFVARPQPASNEFSPDAPPLHVCPDRRFDELGQRLALAQRRLNPWASSGQA